MHKVRELQHRIILAMVIAERAGRSQVSRDLGRIGGALDTFLLDKATGGQKFASFDQLPNAPAQERPSATVLPFRSRHPGGPGWRRTIDWTM